MPQISHLRAFLEAANTGSFIRAAERLNVSHSALSARIKSLESELGGRLFHRGRHGVTLNESGESVRPLAETAVQAWMQARENVRSVSAGTQPVRAGMQQDLWDIFAPAWYARLRDVNPPVQLRLNSDYSDTLCRLIADDLMDLAIVFQPSDNRDVCLKKIASLPVVMVSDKAARWTGQLPEDYFYVNWGDRFNAEHLAEVGDFSLSPLHVGVSGIALATIRSFGGTAYLLRPSIKALLTDEQLFEVSGAPVFQVDAFLAMSASSSAQSRFSTLIEAVFETANGLGGRR